MNDKYYPGISDMDERKLYKLAELTNQLDLCLRTLNHRDEDTYPIITYVFNKLKHDIQPLLTEREVPADFVRDGLYREIR
jgi:hypothetical protein